MTATNPALPRGKYHLKFYHNWLLDQIELIIFGKISEFGEREAQYKTSTRWFLNYALFGLELVGLHYVFSNYVFNNLTSLIASSLSYIASGCIIGSIIQGFDNCIAQVDLEKKFKIPSMFIGCINGILCCMMMELSSILIPNMIIAFTVSTIISENSMCAIEKAARISLENCEKMQSASLFGIFKNMFKNFINEVPETFIANISQSFENGAIICHELKIPNSNFIFRLYNQILSNSGSLYTFISNQLTTTLPSETTQEDVQITNENQAQNDNYHANKVNSAKPKSCRGSGISA